MVGGPADDGRASFFFPLPSVLSQSSLVLSILSGIVHIVLLDQTNSNSSGYAGTAALIPHDIRILLTF